MNFRGKLSIIITLLAVLALTTPVLAASTTPRLVLQITVDALRGDLPNRYYDRLGESGFRYLWEKGTLYTDATTPMQTPKPSLVIRPWQHSSGSNHHRDQQVSRWWKSSTGKRNKTDTGGVRDSNL